MTEWAALDGEGRVDLIVAALARLVADGDSVLELGVESGRVAVGLAAAGRNVTVIDPRAEILDSLQDRAREAGCSLSTILGDLRDFQSGPHELIYSLCSRMLELVSQDDQVACFANVSQALGDGGVFLIETPLPPSPHDQVVSIDLADGDVVVLLESYDQVTQLYSRARLAGRGENVRISHRQLRYTSLAEFDLMARLAGLDLKARWGTWSADPVNRFSRYVVSLYTLSLNPPRDFRWESGACPA
ncbi:class I SAM-dependent methyltransferase [Spirillospora sp. NPDC047279]|uniref:class I SAM-dependent methyltransferase n=1 Tax=Spirillospora sp. NPDC047279 TaxID=3155478 RepID=UPI0033C1BDC9